MADDTEGRDPGPGAEGASSDERSESVERQMAKTKSSAPGQTGAPGDEQPAQSDDLATDKSESTHGVGDSTTTSGEDVADTKEAGREDTGTEGESERPTGTSSARDVTGINPQD